MYSAVDNSGGCSPSYAVSPIVNENSMPEFLVDTHFRHAQTADLAVDLSDVQTWGHNNDFLAATHPTPAPLQTNQVSQASQPPVTLKEILKLKTKMNELAVKVASFTSEPFEKYVLSQADLESMVSLEDRKEILDDKIASLERILHSKTAPAAPPQAKKETAPIMGPMHDAGYASTYAATVLSKQAVPPDQRQTKTNDCGQIKDLKWNMPCRANYVPIWPLNDGPEHEPNADLQRSPTSMQDCQLPFRRLTKDEYLRHCVPPHCQEKVNYRLAKLKEENGKKSWKISPLEFLSWCCYYILWAYEREK